MSTRLLVPALLALVLILPACFNGSHNNHREGGTDGRFRLTIEPDRTDISGTHFLVDSATGDLWRLEKAGGSLEWARLANAPEDAADVTALGTPVSEDD